MVHLINVITFRATVFTSLNWGWDYGAVDRPTRLPVRSRPAASVSESREEEP